jgi:hypothetical protein
MSTDHLRFALRVPVLAALAVALASCTDPVPASLPSETPPPPALSPTAAPPATKPTPGPTALASDVACPVEGPWSIELVVSGGFAGVERKIEVDSSGEVQVEDLQTGEKVESTLPAETLQQIEDDLSGVCHASDAGRPPACADCFSYSLEVSIGGQAYHLVFNDLSLPESPAAALVQDLTRLITETIGP